MKKILLLLLIGVSLLSCECPYAEYEKTIRYDYDGFYASKLLGEWQCYYPMFIGNVEFKGIRFYEGGIADITMSSPNNGNYFTHSFKYSYYGRTLKFVRGNSHVSFQITGYLYPELYLRDSFGEYTMAKRKPYNCINQ